jgi:hypothetical protein
MFTRRPHLGFTAALIAAMAAAQSVGKHFAQTPTFTGVRRKSCLSITHHIRQNGPKHFTHQSGCGPREVARRLRQMARG